MLRNLFRGQQNKKPPEKPENLEQKYSKQLAILESKGFTNKEHNLQQLKAFNGEVRYVLMNYYEPKQKKKPTDERKQACTITPLPSPPPVHSFCMFIVRSTRAPYFIECTLDPPFRIPLPQKTRKTNSNLQRSFYNLQTPSSHGQRSSIYNP